MIRPQPTFHSFTTNQLVALAYGLDAHLDGGFAKDSADYAELIDSDVLAAVQAEIGHDELSPLLDEITFALQARHPATFGASFAAWHAWNWRSMSWSQALLAGAIAAAQDAAQAAAA